MTMKMKGIRNQGMTRLGLSVVLAGVMLGLTLLSAAAPRPARAATLTVCPPGPPTCQYATLQAAVDAAQNGDTIKVATGVYIGVNNQGGLAQGVYVNKSITIQGGYTTAFIEPPDPQANPTTLDANGQGRGMTIMGPVAVTIEGLRLTNGRATNMGGLYMGQYTCNNPSGRGAGGGICIQGATVTLRNTWIMTNTASASGGYGGGLFASGATVTLTHSIIQNNRAGNGSNLSWGGGIALLGGEAWLEDNAILTNQANPNYDGQGGGVYARQSAVTMVHNTVQGNKVRGSTSSSLLLGGGGLAIEGAGATIMANRIVSNTAAGYVGGGLSWKDGLITVTANLVLSNTAKWGGGLWVGNAPAVVENNVIAGNAATAHGNAIYVNTYNPNIPVLRHNTIARNAGGDGSAIYVEDYGRVRFTNSILAGNTVGIGGGYGTNISLERTLWDGNITDTVTLVNEVGHLTGVAAFAEDGYHLTELSDAVDAGIGAGVTSDIDGDPRPRGSAPDLGADESPYTHGTVGEGVRLEKLALPPRLMASSHPLTGAPVYLLQQEYLIRLSNTTTDTTLSSYRVTDVLPDVLDFAGEVHYPALDFHRRGNVLSWQSPAPLGSGELAWMAVAGNALAEDSGQVVTNTAAVTYTLAAGDAGGQSVEVVSTLPNFPPFIAWPEKGEFCLNRAGQLEIRGLAQPGATVHVYAGGVFQTQAVASAAGEFFVVYTPTQWSAISPVVLTARDCTAGVCGDPSNAVAVRAPDHGWCPQRSIWEGVLGGRVVRRPFRNASGEMATSDWEIPAVHYGYTGNRVVIYECAPPLEGYSVSNVAVEVDGTLYQDEDGPDADGAWEFGIGSGHSISIIVSTVQTNGAEGVTYVTYGGGPLIDPDGFIFDVTQGLEVISRTLDGVPLAVGNTIPGVTVTAMVSMPQWGGWVPWPAHLYNNQVNPQVTGEDGYFAFFTPPGFYYLQVEGIPGYQPWRSPVVQVINEIVHVNVPYTPRPTETVASLALTPDGPSQPAIQVGVGDSVEWVATWPADAPLNDLARYRENPALRLRSTLDPLTNTLGWDGGMLSPGSVYRRQFTRPGTYTYSDGAGHTGQVIVMARVYLPLVVRTH